jgi:hypothetical protein
MAVSDAPTGAIAHTEIAVAVTDGRALAGLATDAGPLFDALRLAPPPSADGLAARPVGRLHVGNEFCERLIPSPTLMKRAIALADAAGLALTLATPSVPDAGLARLRQLFRLLPEGSEAVVNDYGVLRLLAREFPALEPVAGRQLCKMIKDPRLPNEQWARLNPPGLGSPTFEAILGRFGVRWTCRPSPARPTCGPVGWRFRCMRPSAMRCAGGSAASVRCASRGWRSSARTRYAGKNVCAMPAG